MQPLRSYIVRIYRQGARTLTGIVEDPQSGATHPFGSMEEVWVHLRARKRRPPARARSVGKIP
jgi:hypothetical protein